MTEQTVTLYRPTGANELAQVKASGFSYVTRFEVKKAFMDQYQLQQVGATHHTERWIPADDLATLNENIAGVIEVIGEYR